MGCLCGNTIEEVARTLCVSHSTVERVMKTYDMTGEVTLVQQRHGPCQTLSESEQLALLQLCLDDPGIFLKEIQQELQHACGKYVSLATIIM